MKIRNRQFGFSAIIVVVLIVLFALLGTYMVSMSSISSLNTTQSASAMQSWFAARAGVEWAVKQSLEASAGGCGCAASCCTAWNTGPINFSEGGLDGYTATVNCSVSSVTEAGTNYCVYNLNITGTNSSTSQLTTASRIISLSISDRDAP